MRAARLGKTAPSASTAAPVQQTPPFAPTAAKPHPFTHEQRQLLIGVIQLAIDQCTPIGAAQRIAELQAQLAAVPLAHRGLLCSHCGGHHTSIEHQLEFCGEHGCDHALIFSCRDCNGLTRIDFEADENGDSRWAASKTDSAAVGVELARIAQAEEQAAASRAASGRRCTVDGVMYPSIVEASRANGLPYSRLYNGLHRFGGGACAIAGKTYRLVR